MKPPLIPSETRTRLNAASDLLRDAREELSRRLESLRNHMANVAAGLAQDNIVDFEQSVDAMQDVIVRLMARIERLELQAGIYWDEPEPVQWEDFRVRVN